MNVVIAKASGSYRNKKEDFPEEKSSKVNLCDYVKDYRTFMADFQKLVDFAEWYHECVQS